MIYNYLLSTKSHPTAETVYENLKSQISNLSLGTVYRNLKLLESLGKVRRVTTLQNVERYDADCSDHAHFVCANCGCVLDLCDVDMSGIKAVANVDNSIGRVNWVDLTMEGICNDCLNNN